MRNTSLDVDFLKTTSKKKNQVLLSKVIKTLGGTRELPPCCAALLVECQLRNEKYLEYHLTMKSTENVIGDF